MALAVHSPVNRYPTEKQALAHLRQEWADRPVLIQPIETSTGVGVPDLYVWASPRGWWLELKRGPADLSPAQRRWLTTARRLGVPCGVLRVWWDYRYTLYCGRPTPTTAMTAMALLTRLRRGHDLIY